MRLTLLATAAVGAAAALAPATAFAVDYLSAEQAARLMFPDADAFEVRRLTLDAAQLQQLDAQGVRARSAGWTVRVAQRAGVVQGFVVADEVVGKVELISYAVAVALDGAVRQIEILSYRESHGHEIRLPAWRRQFVGKGTTAAIRVGEDINNISGATLSCSHVTDGVRRIVAVLALARRAGALVMGRAAAPVALRRARPLLGTVVEIGLCWPVGVADGTGPVAGHAGPSHQAGGAANGTSPPADVASAALEAGFAAIHHAQACLSRFDPASDLSLFHALPVGQRLAVRPVTGQVLAAAQALRLASDGLFDISLGSAPAGWWLDGAWLEKRDGAVRLDLGGIGKGHAVDLAVQALQQHGAVAGWVNAGGDLRAFGDLDLPVQLRQAGGGVRTFAHLRDGAFATSVFGPGQCSSLAGRGEGRFEGSATTRPGRSWRSSRAGRCATADTAHVSVAAPLCLWADALTKLVAASGNPAHALLAQHGASAWWHGMPP